MSWHRYRKDETYFYYSTRGSCFHLIEYRIRKTNFMKFYTQLTTDEKAARCSCVSIKFSARYTYAKNDTPSRWGKGYQIEMTSYKGGVLIGCLHIRKAIIKQLLSNEVQ